MSWSSIFSQKWAGDRPHHQVEGWSAGSIPKRACAPDGFIPFAEQTGYQSNNALGYRPCFCGPHALASC